MKKLLLGLVIVLIALVSLTSCIPEDAGYMNIENTPLPVVISGPVPTVTVAPIPIPLPVQITPTPLPVTIPTPVPVIVPTPLPVTVPTPVPVIQDAVVDTNDSSTANLNAGATFTGTGTSTLGVNSIQVSIKTDQNCTVYVDQSPNAVPNWDVTDSFSYIASLGGNSWTVQAVQSYVRIRVTNIGTATTTYLRLQTVLCPIVEALPRATTPDGRLKTESHLTDDYGFDAEFTPMNEIRVTEVYKLAGAPFIGTTVDSNFWTVTNTNGGTTTQTGGQMTLQTNGADGATAVTSVRRGRYVAGASLRYRSVIQLDSGLANNTRRWGVADWTTLPTITDGAYYQLSGTTFSIVTLKGGTPTVVSSGSFNGVYGSTYILDTGVHTFEIYWTNSKVYFSLDGSLLHTVSATSAPWTNTPTLYIWMDNINTGGLATNKVLNVRVTSISRLGPLQTAPIYKHLTTGTTVCKYGAGTLHSIIVNTPANQTVTLYDNTAGSGTVMAVITLGNNTVPIELHYDMDFYTGLTIVLSGTVDITAIYE